jgi:transmembrane sensor
MNSVDKERDAIEATAAEWLARRDRRFTAEEAVAFARWSMADPRHREAIADLETTWAALDGLSAKVSQQRAGDVAVASPAQSPATVSYNTGRRKARMPAAWWPALGLAAVLALVAGLWFWREASDGAEPTLRYATVVGVQRTVGLSDGSELRLNTDTAVIVQFDRKHRQVLLERGEAFFSVVPEPKRPFVVRARGIEARVVGTTFAVRVRDESGEIELLVAEGRVLFGREGAINPPVARAQRGLIVWAEQTEARITTLDDAAIARRLAWQNGRIEFKNTPLAEAVAEMNRYQRRQVVLRDAAIQELPLGGGFKLGNLETFARIVEAADLGVMVVEQDADRIVLGQRL